jgi:hypothetical protein
VVGRDPALRRLHGFVVERERLLRGELDVLPNALDIRRHQSANDERAVLFVNVGRALRIEPIGEDFEVVYGYGAGRSGHQILRREMVTGDWNSK